MGGLISERIQWIISSLPSIIVYKSIINGLGEPLNSFPPYLDGTPEDDDLQDRVWLAGVDGGHVVERGVDGPVDPVGELPGERPGLVVSELPLHHMPEQLRSEEPQKHE